MIKIQGSHSQRRRGISLVITVSVMMVLSVMGVTFVRMATFERTAADNYSSYVDAKLTAQAGIDYAVAIMFEQVRTEGRINWRQGRITGEQFNRLLYPPITSDPDLRFVTSQIGQAIALGAQHNTTDLDVELASQQVIGTGARGPQIISLYEGELHNGRFSYSGVVGGPRPNGIERSGRFEPNGNFFSLKITNNSGKLNLNSHISFVQDDLTAGKPAAQKINDNFTSNTISNTVMRRLIRALAQACGVGSGDLNTLVNNLRPLNFVPLNLSDRRFQTIDEVRTALANIPDSLAKDRFLDCVCVDSPIQRSSAAAKIKSINEAPTYYFEFRAPIQINSAPREVLEAAISSVQATGVFYANKVALTLDNTFKKNFSSEDVLLNEPIEVPIDFSSSPDNQPPSVGANMALKILDRIQNVGEFKDHAEFNEFLEGLVLDSGVPTFNGRPIFPEKPQALQLENPDDIIIPDRVWNQACCDALKSNFNPNVLDNTWNPNRPAHVRVSKGELFINNAEFARHTTEFTFVDIAGPEIVSVGRVTAQGGTILASSAVVKATIEFGEVLRHTTQEDFHPTSSGNLTGNVISAPANRLLTGNESDQHAGYVEPKPANVPLIQGNKLIFDSTDTFAGNFTVGQSRPVHPPDRNDNTLPSKTITPMTGRKIKISNTRNRDSQPTDLAHDGIVNKRTFHFNSFRNHYFVEGAFDGTATVARDFLSNGNLRPAKASDQPKDSNLRDDKKEGLNVGNYEGTIEFWVKLDVDSDDRNDKEPAKPEVACGLLGVTTRSQNLRGTNINQASGITISSDPMTEGVQMYLYKNTLGQLRLSRLYYAICFHEKNKIADAYGAVFDFNVDQKRNFPRRDVVVDNITRRSNNPWKAHEWHHVRIAWDDTRDDPRSLAMFLDGKREGNFENNDDPSLHPEWAVLNEIDPLDSFFINGFFRNQAEEGGYFFFNKIVHYFGNATIDELNSYEKADFNDDFKPVRYQAGAKYVNRFQIPNSGTMGPLIWMAYPPRFKVANPALPKVELTGTIQRGTTSQIVGNYGVPGTDTTVSVPTGDVKVNAGDIVEYTATFTSVTGLPATLDSVEVILMHSYPRIITMDFIE